MMIPRLSASELLSRRQNRFDLQETVARQIIDRVRTYKDRALIELSHEIDGISLDMEGLQVSRDEIMRARAVVDREFMDAAMFAFENIKAFHERQPIASWTMELDGDGFLGQRMAPLKRVGIYTPGGKAAYPSTVMMTAIPARVAGVEEIIMCTPLSKNGEINPFVLVAADICGVDKIFKVGGAQAIAAMAYGTDIVPRVDKIVGPGNAFVTSAKKLVYGDVGIDMLAGPSEILILADDTADPAFVAADMLSQAEHDELASAVLITTAAGLSDLVDAEVERQTRNAPRREVIIKALMRNGGAVKVSSMGEAIEISNEYAPEHLELLVADPMALLEKIRNAGTIFLGHYSPEPIGDYVAGPNHVLPTLGCARYRGTLGCLDFLKPINVVKYSPRNLAKASPYAIKLAETEGLFAHANSMRIRLDSIGAIQCQDNSAKDTKQDPRSDESMMQGSRPDESMTQDSHPDESMAGSRGNEAS